MPHRPIHRFHRQETPSPAGSDDRACSNPCRSRGHRCIGLPGSARRCSPEGRLPKRRSRRTAAGGCSRPSRPERYRRYRGALPGRRVERSSRRPAPPDTLQNNASPERLRCSPTRRGRTTERHRPPIDKRRGSGQNRKLRTSSANGRPRIRGEGQALKGYTPSRARVKAPGRGVQTRAAAESGEPPEKSLEAVPAVAVPSRTARVSEAALASGAAMVRFSRRARKAQAPARATFAQRWHHASVAETASTRARRRVTDALHTRAALTRGASRTRSTAATSRGTSVCHCSIAGGAAFPASAAAGEGGP